MLDELRTEIDRLDEQLLLLLSKRMEVARRIGGEAKARGGRPLSATRLGRRL